MAKDRYQIRQYSHFPDRRMTDKLITTFDVLKDALEYSIEHNIQKDTNKIRQDKYGTPRHIGNYLYTENERYYIVDLTKISYI